MIKVMEDNNDKRECIYVVTYTDKQGKEQKKYYRNDMRNDRGADLAYRLSNRMNGRVDKVWMSKEEYEKASGDKDAWLWGEGVQG